MIQGVNMTTSQWRLAGAAAFFLVIFVSGFWLRRTGKPYSVMISNIHKLVALAAGILLLIILFRVNRETGLGTTEWVVGVVTGLLLLVNGISGGLVMLDTPMQAVVSVMHMILPFLALLSSAATLYLLIGP
jgi:hypothetical protein